MALYDNQYYTAEKGNRLPHPTPFHSLLLVGRGGSEPKLPSLTPSLAEEDVTCPTVRSKCPVLRHVLAVVISNVTSACCHVRMRAGVTLDTVFLCVLTGCCPPFTDKGTCSIPCDLRLM